MFHVINSAVLLVTVVLAQDDNYGFPESALLDPSVQFGRLTLTPSNFQSLIGNPGFTAVSSPSGGSVVSNPARVSFPEEEAESITPRQFEASVPSNDIFIEDFSPLPTATTFRPSNSPASFTSGIQSFSGSFNAAPPDNTFTSSTFALSQNTPATPTSIPRTNPIIVPSSNIQRINNNRLGKSSLGQTFGRQTAADEGVQGGVDFSQATRTADGRLCVIKEESVETLSKDPILQCTHRQQEKCHYTYITFFKAAQEEVCEENFEKKCQITFKQEATTETVRKCYRPMEKVCNGQGEEECRTVYESSCSTRYIEKSPGKFVGDTSCEKLPVKICGRGCVTEEGPEECHEKQVDSLIDVPEEVCDLNPQKTCRLQTKLVPSLKPKQECTTVPQETCTLNFSQPKRERKPLRTEWCLDEGTGSSQAQPAAPAAIPTGYSRNQKSSFTR